MAHKFYNTTYLTFQTKQDLLNNAIVLSDSYKVDKLDCRISFSREVCEMSLEEILKKFTHQSHFTIIQRNTPVESFGEVSFSVNENGATYSLWVFLSLENLEVLVTLFNLK